VERIVDRFSFQISKFGDPVPDIVAVWITFLGLGDGVEDPLGGSQPSRLGAIARRERA
jgi:hypothetical protein